MTHNTSLVDTVTANPVLIVILMVILIGFAAWLIRVLSSCGLLERLRFLRIKGFEMYFDPPKDDY